MKSEVRDLLQKLESKERRIHELEGKRGPESCDVDNDSNNRCDDQLAAAKLYTLVGRLNEQVRFFVYSSYIYTTNVTEVYQEYTV